jgi:hypothetical protein
MTKKSKIYPTLFSVGLLIIASGCQYFYPKGSPDRVVVGANQAVMEGMIVQQMRTIHRAERNYKAENGNYASLDDLVEKGLINRNPSGHLSYQFTLTADQNSFQCVAVPSTYPSSGRNSYYVDESGSVRRADHSGKPATAADPVVD